MNESLTSEGIKVIQVDLPDFDFIEVYPVSDLHWGEPETDEQMFLNFIEFILSEPNRFVILNGDLLNTALTISVSDTYSEKYAPSEGITSLAFHLAKLVQKDRILAMGTGNHEDRVYKVTGIDSSKYLAMESGLPMERYSSNSFLVFVKFGKSAISRPSKQKKNVYSIFCHHGVGGGRLKGGKINMVVRMNQIVTADVFVVGHVHDPMLTGTKIFETDNSNMTIREKKQYYIISNAWQIYGGYGQKFGFPPAFTDMSFMKIKGNGSKKIKLELGIWE